MNRLHSQVKYDQSFYRLNGNDHWKSSQMIDEIMLHAQGHYDNLVGMQQFKLESMRHEFEVNIFTVVEVVTLLFHHIFRTKNWTRLTR